MVGRLLKPAEFAEKQLIEGILEGRYPQGEPLPAERIMAQDLGVTRPTLRETLKRLSSQGWVVIRHGKPTRVNRYFENGGLGVLSAMVQYSKHLPEQLIQNLLEVRTALLPDIARTAAQNNPEALLGILKESESLKDDRFVYTDYDWRLQIAMISETRNPVFRMIFNDFESLYVLAGPRYFQSKSHREASMTYYRQLAAMIETPGADIGPVVRTMMKRSETIWENLL